ncbi:uncharacterized protein EI97DRAFT_455013 [Westerdykella ornata]|uniref:Uncharacterized protein n=1 Tax=Westerdykella ornata TaxID=318751 RepID=A0A6A6JUM7_WESOR|nr:uncharacterized protein EI97DRAFT_455013 [Westerdykella ornata]KAF2280087.1 hypothetical protein EI97DRAFT_455013 [Westerdykella ornata]
MSHGNSSSTGGNSHQNFNVVRDGRSPDTALLSFGIRNHPDEEFRYLAHHLGQWILVNAAEGREYTQLGTPVYNVDTLTPVEWIAPLPELPQTTAFNREFEDINEVNRQFDETDRGQESSKNKDKSSKAANLKNAGKEPKSGPGSEDRKPGPDLGAGGDGSAGVTT